MGRLARLGDSPTLPWEFAQTSPLYCLRAIIWSILRITRDLLQTPLITASDNS